ncbi:MAG: sodium:glutamate symporter [Spirochaetaceae bacterium]|nr:sodium:glutamate symporter [Spirochaetaceae bacterium]
MNFAWELFVDLGIIGLALAFATLLRARIGFFQSLLIPNAIIAGLLLLPFYNWVAPLLGIGRGGLENLVFHLLNLTFIAIALRPSPPRRRSRAVLGTATVIISQFALQGLLGLGLTFLFIVVPILPALFPSYGFLVTLGYVLGPGQAFSIGLSWQPLGFADAASLGLIFGSIGFLVACFGGLWLINLGMRRGYLKLGADEIRARRSDSGLLARGDRRPAGLRQTTRSEAIDTLSLMLAAVFGVYLVTYLLLRGLTGLLMPIGGAVAQIAEGLWGIAFVFGLLVALLVKAVLRRAKWDHLLEERGLTRISGGAVDFMVAAALGAISLSVVRTNWLPIVVFALLMAALAALTIMWLGSRLFAGDFAFERVVLFWGTLTGTLSTGLALLRAVDPEFKTPAASDYLYASALAFFLVLPLILVSGFPALAHANGNRSLYLVTVVVLLLYVVLVAAAHALLCRRAGRRAFADITRPWASS